LPNAEPQHFPAIAPNPFRNNVGPADFPAIGPNNFFGNDAFDEGLGPERTSERLRALRLQNYDHGLYLLGQRHQGAAPLARQPVEPVQNGHGNLGPQAINEERLERGIQGRAEAEAELARLTRENEAAMARYRQHRNIRNGGQQFGGDRAN
jgi:hypothetical protein